MWNLNRWLKRSKYIRPVVENIPSGTVTSQKLSASKKQNTCDDTLLLDRLSLYWQDSNWEDLSRTSAAELELHSEREKLALLVAAANEKVGQPNTASEFLQLAKNWGASNREIAQFLISGVHGTLGRARLLSGSPIDAERHFSHSLPVKNMNETGQVSAVMRMKHEATMLNLTDKQLESSTEPKKSTSPESNFYDSTMSFENLSTKINESIKSEIGKGMRQLEAYIGIQSYLLHRQLPPALHGWPISPDFGYFLLQTIESEQYDLIVEFGSGTSTLLIAAALENKRKKSTASVDRTIQIAFEHLKKYFEKTKQILKENDLLESVGLVLAELEEQQDYHDGETYNYYGCKKKLAEIKNTTAMQKILIVVDGPPESTGKHARYLAIPLILEYFPTAELDILLDDFARPDEKETVQKWTKLLKKKNRVFQHRTLDFEKGASHLHVELAS